MADFGPAITCLSGAMSAFITQEAVKLTARVTSIVASFTDPLDALASTNVKQLANDVSSAASGNIAGNLASLGAAIIVGKVKRELNSILADVIKANPGVGDAIQRITNLSEAVYGIISLAVLLRKEAPYSAVKLIIDDLEEILTTKENSLKSMKTHIVQMNNVLQATTDNPTNTALQLKADLAIVSADLKTASNHLLTLQTNLAATTSVFVQKEFDAAVAKINSADSVLCPETDTNLLDVGSALAQGSLGAEFLTDAQIKMSSYSIRPLSVIIECEMKAIERANKRITLFLDRLGDVIPSYEDAVKSEGMKNFQIKLVAELRKRVDALTNDIDKAIAKDSIDTLALHSLSWCGRMGAIKEMAPKVENQLTAGSDDQDRLDQMNKEVEDMLDAIEDINSTNVTEGVEDLTAMKSQINTLVGQGKAIVKLMGTSQLTSFDISSFQITVNTVTRSGDSAIAESLSTITKLRSALALFKTEPPADQRLDQLLALLELMGLDRAKDLLKIGKFKDFLDTTIDDASYIGLIIKCIVDAEGLVEDTVTLDLLTGIRETLEGQRISELSAAFDILDSGKNSAILEIKNKLAEGQANLEKVKRIISTLQDLAKKAGETAVDLSEAAEGLGQELGEVATGLGGSLNESLSDLDIDGLQSGCSGQLRF
jgi:hypothetical protein